GEAGEVGEVEEVGEAEEKDEEKRKKKVEEDKEEEKIAEIVEEVEKEEAEEKVEEVEEVEKEEAEKEVAEKTSARKKPKPKQKVKVRQKHKVAKEKEKKRESEIKKGMGGERENRKDAEGNEVGNVVGIDVGISLDNDKRGDEVNVERRKRRNGNHLLKEENKQLKNVHKYNLKNNEVDKILKKYLNLKREENVQREGAYGNAINDILDIKEKKFKIDTINFFSNFKSEECFHDILFFFDSYDKKLKKKKTNKNKYKTEKFKKEIKIVQIVRCFAEIENISNSKSTTDKRKQSCNDHDQNNKNTWCNNKNKMYLLYDHIQDESIINQFNKNKMYHIIFNRQKEYTKESRAFRMLQQWNDTNKLIMLRDKLEEIKKRKILSNIPLSYIQLLKDKLMCSILNICCLNNYSLSKYEFEFPPYPLLYQQKYAHDTLDKKKLNTSYGANYSLKMGTAIRVLASK
ncbi:conserved Plasmodium protein, unknown function, partial [Plasmodium malariae]